MSPSKRIESPESLTGLTTAVALFLLPFYELTEGVLDCYELVAPILPEIFRCSHIRERIVATKVLVRTWAGLPMRQRAAKQYLRTLQTQLGIGDLDDARSLPPSATTSVTVT
jgi:hypothetical protein